MELFCYVIDFGSVSSADNVTKVLNFDTDSDFRLDHVRLDIDDTTRATLTLQRENGKQMSNAALEARAIAGANGVLNLFGGAIIKRNAVLTATAAVSAGTSKPFQIQLWGYKLQ